MATITVTKATFEKEVLQADKPVLVDFWASWCGPCKMLSPVLEEVAAETDEFKVCKINVDEEEELAAQFNVMSIPTLIVMEGGSPVRKSVGYIGKEEVKKLVLGS